MLVRQDVVPPEKMLEGEGVTIRCAHEDEVFSLAEVDVEVDGKLRQLCQFCWGQMCQS